LGLSLNQVVHTYIQLHMNSVFAEVLSEKPAVRVLFNKWRLPDKWKLLFTPSTVTRRLGSPPNRA
jgi:hypothetical protein